MEGNISSRLVRIFCVYHTKKRICPSDSCLNDHQHVTAWWMRSMLARWAKVRKHNSPPPMADGMYLEVIVAALEGSPRDLWILQVSEAWPRPNASEPRSWTRVVSWRSMLVILNLFKFDFEIYEVPLLLDPGMSAPMYTAEMMKS